jgi:hypothetical protein
LAAPKTTNDKPAIPGCHRPFTLFRQSREVARLISTLHIANILQDFMDEKV